jgi:thymidine kinase
MGSGKTTHLTTELTRYADIGYSTIYINHADDNRNGSKEFSTHNSQLLQLSPHLTLNKSDKLSTVDVSSYLVIGVDECQFFTDLRSTVEEWLNQDKIVICSGLDGDSFMQPFGQVLSLIPLADRLEKLKAKCEVCLSLNVRDGRICGPVLDAPFTARKVASKEQKLIGGRDLYTPVCRMHYKRLQETGAQSH